MAKPPPSRIHIQYPQPVVDAGRYPAKRTVGDLVEVSADVFRDGHEKLRAVALHRRAGTRKWAEAELHPLDAHHNGVRWGGSFVVDKLGRWEFTIAAWTDVFATWRDELQRKLEAGQHHLAGELSEGALLLQDVAPRAPTAS
jgi:starch synthase (maltosyl-transferring)